MAVPNDITFRLSPCHSSVPRARAVLHVALGDWTADQEIVETAELVLSELVTNALQVRTPCQRQSRHVGVRISHAEQDGTLTLEVSDDGAGSPTKQAPAVEEASGRGLLLVDALAHQWGVQERANGFGKTVWAELRAPGVVDPPAGRRVAAVTVRTGQRVQARGGWRTVRGVRAERQATGGVAVLVTLDDDGPALRVPAAEPLLVHEDGVWAATRQP